MKILYINNFFSAQGGAEFIMIEAARLMEQNGHTVHFFATDKGPYFLPHETDTSFFPPFKDFRKISPLKALPYLAGTIFNRESQFRLSKVLKTMKPDLIHIHNLHYHLTPSILLACSAHNIPVVMTLHDVRLICPGGTLYNNGEPDLFCKTGKPMACLRSRCKNGNLPETLLCFVEYFWNRMFNLYRGVHTFVTPSKALKDLMIEQGLSAEKVVHINNFLNLEQFNSKPSFSNQGYFLFAGRLSQEKGIHYLLEAMAQLPDLTLYIAGQGPYEDKLKAIATKLNLNNIKFLGFMEAQDLEIYYRNCIATVLPAIWFEIFGLTLIESFLYGKPVIASNIGAIPELVTEGETGLLIEPGNVHDLTEKLKFLAQNPERVIQMGKAGRRKAEQLFKPDRHQKALEDLYQKVLANPKGASMH